MNQIDEAYNIPIAKEPDVSLLVETAGLVAADMGFDAIAVGEIKLAVSEIGQNAFTHAGGGEAVVSSMKKGKVIRVVIKDEGVGIENISLAMREGFSTLRTSLGLGLEAAQRLMDKFEIHSEKGKGTSIMMEKYLPMTTDRIEYGLVCVPDQQYNFNGDEYIIKEFDGDKVLLGVIDGFGQGYDAYTMSMLLKKFIEKNYSLSLEVLINSCHQLLKESELSGGATISLLLVEPHQVSYLGVGDTHTYLCNGAQQRLSNFEGRVGDYQLPTLKIKKYPIHGEVDIVMCTDGISTQVGDKDLPVNGTAQDLAKFVFNEYHKPYGDVTVLVTKLKDKSDFS